ncbi:unnamed protein product [Penicillium glandicola]
MKGFIGGIPVALLAVAAQAKFAERQPPAGGTAIGGPSGNDADGGFVSPYSASIKVDTQVNEWNKDDHSIKLKHTDVYPRPAVVPVPFGHPGVENRPQVPGAGPFAKRHVPAGTAIGGPSGNDEGQSFDLSVTGIFNTEVNDYNKDDHSIDIKKHVVHPPPHFKRSGPQTGGTAIGGPSGNDGGQSFSAPTTIGVTTGINEHNEDDHSISLKHKDVYAHPHVPGFVPFRRSENHGPPAHGGAPPAGHFEPHPEPHFENHPEPHYAPHYSPSYEPHYEPHTTVDTDITSVKNNNNGPSAGSVTFGRRGFPGAAGPHFEPHPEPHVENHPEPHYAPHYSPSYEPHYEPHTTVDTDITSVKNNNNGPSAGSVTFGRRGFPGAAGPHFEPHPEPHFENHPEAHYEPSYSPSYEPHYEPHTTIDYDLTAVQDNNNGPAAGSVTFGRRAYAPPSEPTSGGTAIGGPSGDDDGTDFSNPTDIDVTTGVDEHNEDNHAIDGDFTHVHPADYSGREGYSPSHAPAEASADDNIEAPQCAGQVHEVVRTVTKTQYKTAEATHVAYQSEPVVGTSAVYVNSPQHSAGADPIYVNSPQHPAGADAMMSPNSASHVPMAAPSGQAYPSTAVSQIPVNVPVATPAAYGSFSKATPSFSHGQLIPTGVSAEQWASPSPSASASGYHEPMFQGGAARLSGGIVSAAAAVMGVLAFIL